jgi:hypothetical protein
MRLPPNIPAACWGNRSAIMPIYLVTIHVSLPHKLNLFPILCFRDHRVNRPKSSGNFGGD